MNRYSFSLLGVAWQEFASLIERGAYDEWADTLHPRLRWIAQCRHANYLRWQKWKMRRAAHPDADHNR